MNLLELSDVSVKKPGQSDQLLVNSVSASVNAGEVLAIIGPNGAGKSSLLKAIAGDWDFTGNIQLHGVSNTPTLRARQLAVLPQLSLLNFPYRVEEVVLLGRTPHKTGAKCDLGIVEKALELMDISFLRKRLYTELSGGEKQRVQLARVLAQIWQSEDTASGQRLLLLDEPTTALDLGHQHDLMNAIKTFSKNKVAIVMVLHDINLAAHYADTLLALHHGQRVAYGSPKEVITKDIINHLFNVDVEIIPHPIHNSPVIVGF